MLQMKCTLLFGNAQIRGVTPFFCLQSWFSINIKQREKEQTL